MHRGVFIAAHTVKVAVSWCSFTSTGPVSRTDLDATSYLVPGSATLAANASFVLTPGVASLRSRLWLTLNALLCAALLMPGLDSRMKPAKGVLLQR
jgi:hypothetical protein